MRLLPLIAWLLLSACVAAAEWPGYHGDASGRHYSALSQLSPATLPRLGLAWSMRPGAAAGAAPGFPPQVKTGPVVVGGIAYLTAGADVLALDARTGRIVWRYHWSSTGGASLGRGVAVYGDSVLVQTGADNHLLSLDARTGKERWRHQVTASQAGYAGTTAPILAEGLVILGMGGDGNNLRAWLEARDALTGELRWQWYVTPGPGEEGIETWPNAAAAARGGGMPWQPVTYDADLGLLYVTTANPVPVFNGQVRSGGNLFTNSIVALQASTGRKLWHFQTTPNDTHDYDATQVPMLFDAAVDGRQRALLAQFNRNGYYYVLDRQTGQHLLTTRFLPTANWALRIGADGRPVADPAKNPSVSGSLVSPMSDGAANYPAPAYSPETGLAYVQATDSWSLFYLHPEEQDPIGWGGGSEYHTGFSDSFLLALDAVSGVVRWRHDYPGMGFTTSNHSGLLVTAGGLLFAGDAAGNLVAYEAHTGRTLWHSTIGAVRGAPVSYSLDDRQYVLVTTDDAVFAFALNEPPLPLP